MINPLPLPVQRLVDAAEGWLELGDWRSAQDELSQIEPAQRDHPAVVALRIEVLSAGKRWEEVIEIAHTLSRQLPDHPAGHIRLAFALHELRRTKEAWDTLLPVSDKFPDHWVIPYNLSCYAAQLGDLVGARDWLAQAFKIGGEKKLRTQALEDPDLAPLWNEDQAPPP